MEPEADSFRQTQLSFQASPILLLISTETSGAVIFVIILLICSALISGSEVAFFSLSGNDYDALRQEKSKSAERILSLKEKPRTLLANILITNNFINIAIVIISEYVLRQMLPKELLTNWSSSIVDFFSIGQILSLYTVSRIINFSITVIGVTFLLVLFGEVIPKIYARLNNIKLAKAMSLPLVALGGIFSPLSRLLVKGTNLIENKLQDSTNGFSVASKEEFDQAIELTVRQEKDADREIELLKSIINFKEVSVKQIMKSRMDVTALDIQLTFDEVLKIIKDAGFSRMPVYEEDFDNIKGILYVKDLIGNIDQPNDFNWQKSIRTEILFAPEQKKISELLKDFQSERMHMAIVVDEFGGTAGIVTLEDIMEEVVGDIRDEFDDKPEIDYKKINDFNYEFEGKSLLNDVCRVLSLPTDTFDDNKGEADTLAGLILEIIGYIPKKGREVQHGAFKFKVISSNKRRIEKVLVTLPKE